MMVRLVLPRSSAAAMIAVVMVMLLTSACAGDAESGAAQSEADQPADTAQTSADAPDESDQTTETSAPTTAPSAIPDASSNSPEQDGSGDDGDPSLATSPDADEDPLPGRPSGPNDGQPDENPAWLGRGEMTDSSVELFWAPLDNVDIYEIHRVPVETTTEPENLGLDDSSLVFSGTEIGWIDETVTTGDRYWYIFIGRLTDGTEFRRTTQAHAVTDTEAPLPVLNVNAESSADSIALSWDQSSDNYLFDRYAIRRSVDGEASVYYGTGWTIDQTSFVDDQLPDAGSISYELIAVDFHGNTSAPTVVTGRAGS